MDDSQRGLVGLKAHDLLRREVDRGVVVQLVQELTREHVAVYAVGVAHCAVLG